MSEKVICTGKTSIVWVAKLLLCAEGLCTAVYLLLFVILLILVLAAGKR